MAEEIKLAPPINNPNAGKIIVVVSGPTQVKSNDSRILVVRKT